MKNYIITSIFDPYPLVVDKLINRLEKLGVKVQLIKLEDLKFVDYRIDLEPGLCYFISSGEVAKTMANLLDLNGFTVINKDYIKGGYENKILTQATLSNNGIPMLKSFFSYPITTILSEEDVKESLPLYHKHHLHMETITSLDGYSQSLNFLRKQTATLGYLEKKVDIPKTLKVYLVGGEIFYYKDSNEYKSAQFEKHLLKTAKLLGLEAASIDFVPLENSNYIIDVNHAPAFGGNELAFTSFVNFLKEKNGKSKRSPK